MYIIDAPYPNIQQTLYLPNAELNNSFTPQSETTILTSMNRSRFSYVKRNVSSAVYVWDFDITLEKAREVQSFMKSWQSSKMQVIDHEDSVLIGYFQSNPIQISPARRTDHSESMILNLVFEVI